MNHSVAIFGGGCFWCTEAVFKMLRGVISVEPGYAGGPSTGPSILKSSGLKGSGQAPTYGQVSSGKTGHAEVIKIEYDPEQVSFKNLLTVFFGSHDATQVNRQGNDVGTQYRSVVLYTNDTQKKEAEDFIKELNDSSKEGDPIATEVAPFTKFYPAEQEHLDYYARNKEQGYCQIIIAPKLQKVQEKFADLLKNNSPS